MNVRVIELLDFGIHLEWDEVKEADSYRVYWADKDTKTIIYKLEAETKENNYIVPMATHVNHYFKIAVVSNNREIAISEVIKTGVKKVFHEQLENLSRGLVAVKTNTGIFLSWRLMKNEVNGYSDTGLTGVNFKVYRNGEEIAYVTDSTNYLDIKGSFSDRYSVEAVINNELLSGKSLKNSEDNLFSGRSEEVNVLNSGHNYVDIPLWIPAPGVTPAGNAYTYNANDMSVSDIDGDGEYEFFVKWDPTNSKDVSHSGYTGNCYIDCYKLNGTLLWRLDMGCNIRSGAHYTQFMVYDFDGDGKAEMAVKTAPGTKIIRYKKDRTIESEAYITLLEKDIAAGYSNLDDYRMSNETYVNHLIEVFMNWSEHSEVKRGNWPATLEECFGIEKRYTYPLNRVDSASLVEYFIDVYAKQRSPKNDLRNFEGFILDGPEYLTMFSGDGRELETIKFPHERVDDGLLWGDYAMNRIEPGNRVDRFLSGVAYLDGESPYLIMCRGYYTRTTIVAYSFADGKLKEHFNIDSGFVPMANPFKAGPHEDRGSDPVYGILAGQGNHSLSTADVDQDGCDEIIYGAAVIDQDGSVLYSSFGYLPDGTYAKFGHGDAMHVADIDPDRPGLEIFNVFEGGRYAPYGYALRDAKTGEVIFGEYAERDLGRCMVGDINPDVRGLECWVTKVQSCTGEVLTDKLLGTNQSIRYSADMSTAILDGVTISGGHKGVINDNTHGVILRPEEVATNNGTKGNPCLIADIFGDWREELLLRKADNSAIRIFTSTELTNHKLFTLMHDIQYRCSVAWQNNCYNQPGYTKFYFASDTDFKYVLPIGLPKMESQAES
jgi:hypothetical protein